MDLREAIIRTVSYFDLFDFPLTRAEVWRWLGVHASLADVEAAVSTLVTGGALKEENGTVCLADREGLAAIREERYRHSVRKWRRARRWANVFGALPGVELVGIGNTLAFHDAKDGSDIDFFIVTKPGTLWRTRFLCAGLAALFGLRPRAESNRDTLCLSFFVTGDSLDLRPLRHAGDDAYFTHWTAQMTPLVGEPGAMDRYWKANAWVKRDLPNAQEKTPRAVSHALRTILSPIALLPGALLKGFQMKKFPHELRDAAARDDGAVVITDSVLKFHLNDRRDQIQTRYLERISRTV